MSERVRITDVSPRDGLQNEGGVIPTEGKAALVRALTGAGVDEVEVSSFVSPRWAPQLGDAAELFAMLSDERPVGVVYSALVPNERGMEGALAVNAAAGYGLIRKVSVFTAASETFSRRNTNATIAQTLERFRPVIARALEAGLRVRGYVSCIVACPFEGAISPAAVADVSARLLDLGIDELDLGDTIGHATPDSVEAVLIDVLERTNLGPTSRDGDPSLTLHLHDTFGRAGSCVERALELGVRSFDGSVAGLGGCPYASTPGKRAPGNVATGTLVEVVRRAGYSTGVDLDALGKAAALARSLVDNAGREPGDPA